MEESGVWVVVGSAVGALSSIVTTWLSVNLQRQSPHPRFDKAVTKLLRDLLTSGPSWRKLETLAAVTGLTEQHVKEYLVEMGARGSETNGRLWGLIESNPLSEIDALKAK
jgi:hypothetical protein